MREKLAGSSLGEGCTRGRKHLRVDSQRSRAKDRCFDRWGALRSSREGSCTLESPRRWWLPSALLPEPASGAAATAAAAVWDAISAFPSRVRGVKRQFLQDCNWLAYKPVRPDNAVELSLQFPGFVSDFFDAGFSSTFHLLAPVWRDPRSCR